MELLPKLIEKEIALDDIGIISPYHAQVMKIKKELISRNMKKIRVGTVEGKVTYLMYQLSLMNKTSNFPSDVN